jgi:hypothetical protein
MIAARPVGRRTVLRLGFAGATALALGGGLASWVTAGYASLLEPNDTPIALSVKEFAVVRALVDALFPGEDGFPSGLAIGLPQRVDEEIWAANDFTRGALKDGIQVLEHLPPLHGHPHRFTALDREARVAVFAKLLASRTNTIRQIAVALKQMTHLFYYANEKVWPSIHYDGPFVKEPKPPASAIAYADLLKSRRPA